MISEPPQWIKEERVPFIEVKEGGHQGPYILLLHGLLGASSNWAGVFDSLARFARPISISFPIFIGERDAVSVKALALWTEYFIRSRELDRVFLCGNSLGGHVALRLCLARSELISGLILSAPSGITEIIPTNPTRKDIRKNIVSVFYDPSFITNEMVEEIVKFSRDKRAVLNTIYAARSVKEDNLKNELSGLKVPTLLLWGEEDRITPLDVAKAFQANISDTVLETIPQCGHAPMIEKPEWFSQQIEKFVRTKK